MGGVQSFTPKQGADLAGLGTSVSLVQDAQFLGSAEGSPRRFWHNFRVWWTQ
jgi:hypothetical protein